MKKIVSLILSLVLVLSVFTACNNEKTSGGEKSSISVEVFDRGNAPKNGETADNNRWTKWINEKVLADTGVDVKFHPILRGSEIEMLNVLMASAQAPDIIFTYDKTLYNTFVEQGGLTELTPYIDKYGDNIKKLLGDDLEFMKIDDKIYGLTAKRAYLGQFTSYIRQDWLDKLGLPVPTTTQEWYETIKAFKEKDPGNVGKENVVGFPITAMTFSREDWQQNTLHLVFSFVDTEKMSKRDFYTLSQINYPGYKEGVRFLNKMYLEGLIDSDFALQNDNKKFNEIISTGRAGAFTSDTSVGFAPTGMIGALYDSDPNAKFIAIDPFKNKEGVTAKRLYNPAVMNIMIPAFSENPEGAIKYLNWMSDPKNGFNLMYGEEGEHYELVEDIPVQINPDHIKESKWNNLDLSIMYNGYDFGSEENYFKSLRIQDSVFGPIKEEGSRIALQNGYYDPFFTTIISAESKYRPMLDKKFQELMIKSIMAPSGEFDSVYDGLVKEYMSIGGSELQAEREKAFDAGKYYESNEEGIYKPYK